MNAAGASVNTSNDILQWLQSSKANRGTKISRKPMSAKEKRIWAVIACVVTIQVMIITSMIATHFLSANTRDADLANVLVN